MQWEEVAKKLKDKGLFLTSSVDTIKNKMTVLLTYFEVSLFNLFGGIVKPLLSHSRILTHMLVCRLCESCPVPLPLHLLPFLTKSQRTRWLQEGRMMSRKRRLAWYVLCSIITCT